MTQITNQTVTQVIKRLQSIKNKNIKVELRGDDDGEIVEFIIMFNNNRAYEEVKNNCDVNLTN